VWIHLHSPGKHVDNMILRLLIPIKMKMNVLLLHPSSSFPLNNHAGLFWAEDNMNRYEWWWGPIFNLLGGERESERWMRIKVDSA